MQGPAVIERSKDGKVIYETWCDGSGWFSRHPGEGPAIITRARETGITTEEFMLDGEYVAPPLAALIRRDANGQIIEQEFWNGDALQTSSPAPVDDV